ARGSGRDHVGRTGLAHHRRLARHAPASARYRRSQGRAGVPRAASRYLAGAQGRSAQGLCANRRRVSMHRGKLILLQLLVGVLTIAVWEIGTSVPIGGSYLLPPFFFSNPVDVASRIIKWFVEG